ncbi:MAG: choice-of-anchor D domain-containing protein [Candidatus Sulfotelmatobacter sp.]
MRLPQSGTYPLFLRVTTIFFLLTLTAALPAAAAPNQLVCTPSMLRFGAVTVGQTETQLISLSNVGKTSVTISGSSFTQSEFSLAGIKLPVVIPAGQTLEASVIFAPTVNGWTGSALTFTSNASNGSLTVPMGGGGVKVEMLTATPSSASFGQVPVGQSASMTVVLTNTHAQTDTLDELIPQGTGFTVTGPTMPLALNSGQSVKLTVTFTPQATGLTGGSVFVSGAYLNIPFYGTGTATTIGQLVVVPTSINFGNVEVGTTASQSSSLSATGGSVTVTAAGSSNSQFAIAGVSFPLTIAAGQSVPVSLNFTPTSSGNSSSTLTFVNNGSTTKTLEPAAGTGTMPYVTLSWSPGESSAAGYNVYRGTTPGSYSKINTALDPQTTFVDKSVASGATYYYAATSVDSTGKESTYSQSIEVAVP